ncbi:hypothetical protein Mgra_00008730, partial [Meloidogyne graminicola]
KKYGGYKINNSNNNFRIIYLPININKLKIKSNDPLSMEEAYNEYKNGIKYIRTGIHQEISENQQIIINKEYIGIYDWLKSKEYSFGIAEFSQSAGHFIVFNELKIVNTFNVSSSSFNPNYLQFLDINNINLQIPTYEGPLPNEWIKEQDSNGYIQTFWNDETKLKYQKLHE